MLPTFVVIGAQKSGTDSLVAYLGDHPQVAISAIKEPDFFVADRSWPRGLAWYESLFATGRDALARGEASTSYSMFPHVDGVPARMAAVIPEARLVYLMRDPVERMRSAYVHALAHGTERRPIAMALLTDSRYADPSRYALQIEQYLRHFDRERLLLLTAEALRDDRVATVRRVLEFLGVDATWRSPVLSEEFHRSADKRAPRAGVRLLGATVARGHLARVVPRRLVDMRARGARSLTRPIRPAEVHLDDDLRARLAAVLRPDVERLRAWTGPNFASWS